MFAPDMLPLLEELLFPDVTPLIIDMPLVEALFGTWLELLTQLPN